MLRSTGLKIITTALLLLMPALWGCGGKAPQGAPAQPAQVVQAAQSQAQDKAAPEAARERRQPQRDPFAAAEGETPAEETPLVIAQAEPEIPAEPGRDPFLQGEALPDEKDHVLPEERGRDPFRPAANVPLPEIRPELPTQPGPEPPPPAEEVPPPAEPPITPQPGETVAPGMVTVKLTALDRCWLEVFVDGEHRLRTNVPRGETLIYAGKEIRLEQVGREWALSLTLNGQNLGLLQELVPSLEKGPLTYDFEGTRVQISLGRRYQGGVLVGLSFEVVNN